MPRLRESTRAERRARILAAARRCFARLGTGATTIGDILDEAGISAGAAYSHFDSKEAIIEALAAQSHDRDVSLIRACARPQDVDATIDAFFDLVFEDWRGAGARDGIRLDISWWAESLVNPRIAGILRRSSDDVLEALAEALAIAGLPKAAARARARVLVALVLGLMVQWHLARSLDPFEIEAEVRTAAHAAARGAA